MFQEHAEACLSIRLASSSPGLYISVLLIFQLALLPFFFAFSSFRFARSSIRSFVHFVLFFFTPSHPFVWLFLLAPLSFLLRSFVFLFRPVIFSSCRAFFSSLCYFVMLSFVVSSFCMFTRNLTSEGSRTCSTPSVVQIWGNEWDGEMC